MAANNFNLEEERAHLDNVLRHIGKVRDNCILLGERLIAIGEFDLGKELIANGLIHDNSKLYGIEWKWLRNEGDKDKLILAVEHHACVNPHHPEHWKGIENMPRVYLAEAVCDWAARSSEFGSSLTEWIETNALKRFKFKKQSKTYKQIKYFVDLLLDPSFTPLTKS